MATEASDHTYATLMDVLDARASTSCNKIAYTFLLNGEVESETLSFGELRSRAVAVAARLTWLGARGQRAMLVYPQGLEFIVAFFGCLYAGVIAVPSSVPNRKRGLETLRRVAADAGVNWVLSTGDLLEQIAAGMEADAALQAISWLDTKTCVEGALELVAPKIAAAEVALLQYTSGSSGSPRGVVIRHGNLFANQRQIADLWGHDSDTVIVSWLPMFHDMGLGTIIGAVWAGCRCVLMSPQAFLQNPARWLHAISKYRGTTSGGPDFAYDLCARKITKAERANVDLSSWRLAYDGSEPVRAGTLERFTEAFSECGFKHSAFLPVYGLAEATLLVTSARLGVGPVVRRFSKEGLEQGMASEVAVGSPLVSCGPPGPGTTLSVVNPDSLVECQPGQIGEVWIRGASVAQGYWAKDQQTLDTFAVETASGEGPFLRTGDLGFSSEDGLFITGRRKDLIIIRGRNHYPQDIEDNVSAAHPALVPHACAAFSLETEQGEELVIVQEVARSALRTLDVPSVVRAIRGAISEHHSLHTHAVVLLKPGTLLRTTSGKVRRHACRDAFRNNTLPAIAAWVSPLAPTPDAKEEPDSMRRQLSARADRLIDWLQHHAADLIQAHAANNPLANPVPLLRDLAKQGILGMQVETRYGGLGLGNSDAVRVIEQLAAIDFALALFVGLNNFLGIQPIAKHAGPGLKALLLPALVHGQELAAFAFEEPASHPAPGGIGVEAQADGEDRWRLFGSKYLDGVAQAASVINVFARQDEPPGISAFVISDGLEGLRQVRDGLSMGLLGFARDTISLDGVRVSRDDLLGSLGAGLDIAHEAITHTRLAVGAACIGGMKRCAQLVGRDGPYRDAINGKLTPNPVTLSRLGAITASITALECLVHRIAQAIDAGYAVPSEAFAACKIQGPEMLLRCVDDLMQFGLSGSYAETNRLSTLRRDAGFLRAFGGPPEALSELIGAGVMADDSSLRRLVEEALHAPAVAPRIEIAIAAVRRRMLHLRGPLAMRAQRWGHTRLGELTAWLVLLAAVEGSRGGARSMDLERAHAWAEAQFEHALSAVQFGTPSETATLNTSDLTATFAAYARTIGNAAAYPAVGPADASLLDAVKKTSVQLEPAPSVVPVRTRETRARDLTTWIGSWLARRLQINLLQVEPARSFADHGLDSVAAVELAKALSDKLGRELDETLLWSFSTIDALVSYVIDNEDAAVTDSKLPDATETTPAPSSDPTWEDEVARLERELRFRS